MESDTGPNRSVAPGCLSQVRTRALGRDPDARTRAARIWEHHLSQITTVFGRLGYIGSLRHIGTDQYFEYDLAQAVGEELASEIIRDSHRRIFAEWLALGLQQQAADFNEFVSSRSSYRRAALEQWHSSAFHAELLPAGIMDAERRLYVCDLDAVLQCLLTEYRQDAGRRVCTNMAAESAPLGTR